MLGPGPCGCKSLVDEVDRCSEGAVLCIDICPVDYENHPNTSKLDKLIQEVSLLSGISDDAEILHALQKNSFLVQSSVEYLGRTRQHRKRNQNHRNSIWSEEGTGSRVLGTQVGVYKVPSIHAAWGGEVYQVCWGRISSCEEGKGISGLWGRI